jgi:hypothetical protein
MTVSGDPNCPPQIALAKRIQVDIRQKNDVQLLDDAFATNEGLNDDVEEMIQGVEEEFLELELDQSRSPTSAPGSQNNVDAGTPSPRSQSQAASDAVIKPPNGTFSA